MCAAGFNSSGVRLTRNRCGGGTLSANKDNLIDTVRVDQPIDKFQSLLKKHPQRHQNLVVPPHRAAPVMFEHQQAEIQQPGVGPRSI
jgi:hypothetical protein